MGGNQEIEVAQNLRAKPVTQSDIFEPNQAQLRSMRGGTGNLKPPQARWFRCGRETNKMVLLRLWFPIR
jgi:hypothetical protein